MNTLDLFSGIGGFAIAAEWCNIQTVQFVEINPHKRKLLRHHFPRIPIHADIKTFSPTTQTDIITAGFPCTGTSNAGTRTGLSHEKSSLWYEAYRIITTARPRAAIIEQPVGIINNGLRDILAQFRMAGYSCEITPISARQLGAGHLRRRIFIIAHINSRSCYPQITITGKDKVRDLVNQSRHYAHWLKVKPFSYGNVDGFQWELAGSNRTIPIPRELLEAPKGIKNRLQARIAAGEAVTPQQAHCAFLRCKEILCI